MRLTQRPGGGEQTESFLAKGDQLAQKDCQVLGRLRGIALDAIEDCPDNPEIFKTVQAVFGSVTDAEDLLQQFATRCIYPKE